MTAGTFAGAQGGQFDTVNAGSPEAGMLADMILNAGNKLGLDAIQQSTDYKLATAAGEFDRGAGSDFVGQLANTSIGTPQQGASIQR